MQFNHKNGFIRPQKCPQKEAKARNILVITLKVTSSAVLLFIMFKLLGKVSVAFTPAQAQVVNSLLYMVCFSLHILVWHRK